MFVWNLEIIAVILLAAAFSWFFCRSVVVQEGSVEPTLVPGERVLMDSASVPLKFSETQGISSRSGRVRTKEGEHPHQACDCVAGRDGTDQRRTDPHQRGSL